MRLPRVRLNSAKLCIPFLIAADLLAVWVWAARPTRVYSEWLGLVGRREEAPIYRLLDCAREENAPRTPSGCLSLFETGELFVGGGLLFALFVLILILLAAPRSGNGLWIRLSSPVRAARAVAVRFRVRTALAAIAILGLYLGWEIHAWRTWRLRSSFLWQAATAARRENDNRLLLHSRREELAELIRSERPEFADLFAPELGLYRSKAALAAERLANKDRLERETGYLSAIVAAYAERRRKYEGAAADPWRAVAPDEPLPEPEPHAEGWLRVRDFARALAAYDELARLSPDVVEAHLGSAWLRATCPDSRYRDGKLAVASATRACDLTNWQDVGAVATLAAALAESGDFAAAVKWQEKLVELMIHDPNAQDYRDRLALYKAGKPYRQK